METLDLDVISNHRRRRPIQIKKQTKMLSKLNQYYQSIMIGRFSITYLVVHAQNPDLHLFISKHARNSPTARGLPYKKQLTRF